MDDPIKKLKALRLKVTPQRLAILDIIRGDRTHPSAENVYKKILMKYPGVSFATVYNTLSKLAEAGEIQKLDIDPKKKRFDPDASLHYHFYCKTCGKVYDVDDDTSFTPDIHTVDGHQIEAIQLNFKGVCSACSRK
jgi:Fur family transcriptional regulator, peroxide stress response regulator